MKKSILMTLVIVNLGFSTLAISQTCERRMVNLDFYHASMNEERNKVSCVYRYCYYNCIYDSYTIRGTFKPPRDRYWIKNNETNAYSCSSNHPGDCEFEWDNGEKSNQLQM